MDPPTQLSAAPEANLAFSTALTAYITSLPDAERVPFQEAHSAEDILAEATRYDREHQEKSSVRAFGTRYLHMVDGLQGYFSVIDTVVSSHPEVAACVWAGVRLIIESVGRFFMYFEAISGTISSVAEDLHFYKDYATVLYAKWDKVQTLLVEVYTNLLALCTAVRRIFKHRDGRDRKKWRIVLSAVKRVFSAGPLDRIARDFQACRSKIEREVVHVDRVEAKREREEALKERARAREARERDEEEQRAQSAERKAAQVERQKQDEGRRRVEEEKEHRMIDDFLQRLKPSDVAYTHEQLARVALPGSGDWLLHDDRFVKWVSVDGDSSGILWCHGKPGAGKTVLASIIISELRRKYGDAQDVAIPFFYFASDIPERSQPTAALRTILHQMLSQLPRHSKDDLLSLAREYDERVPRLNYAQIMEAASKHFRRTFLVIDALDECQSFGKLTSTLESLGGQFKLLVLSRESRELAQRFVHAIPLLPSVIDKEIQRFVKQTLEDYQTSKRLVVRDAALISEISETPCSKADGMFLWVALQMKAICRERTDSDIRAALGDLPKNLDETYVRALAAIDRLGARQARRVRLTLWWLVGAMRPLALDELAEAVAVADMAHGVWDASVVATEPRTLVDDCANLCTLAPAPVGGRPVVQLVHASVQDFLLADAATFEHALPAYHISAPRMHWELGRQCFRSIQLAQSTERPASASSSTSDFHGIQFAKYAIEHVCAHLKRSHLKDVLALSAHASTKQLHHALLEAQSPLNGAGDGTAGLADLRRAFARAYKGGLERFSVRHHQNLAQSLDCILGAKSDRPGLHPALEDPHILDLSVLLHFCALDDAGAPSPRAPRRRRRRRDSLSPLRSVGSEQENIARNIRGVCLDNLRHALDLIEVAKDARHAHNPAKRPLLVLNEALREHAPPTAGILERMDEDARRVF